MSYLMNMHTRNHPYSISMQCYKPSETRKSQKSHSMITRITHSKISVSINPHNINPFSDIPNLTGTGPTGF